MYSNEKLSAYIWVGPVDQRHQLLAIVIARTGKEAEQIARAANTQEEKISKQGEVVIVKNAQEAWGVFSRILEQRRLHRAELIANFKALVLQSTGGDWRYVPSLRQLFQDAATYPADERMNLEAADRIIAALTTLPKGATSS